MPVRIFTCGECGHKMRLGGSVCGYCHAPKSFLQRRLSYFLVVLALLGAVVSYVSMVA